MIIGDMPTNFDRNGTRTAPIQKGDTVSYYACKRDAKGRIIYIRLYGLWDGEKVCFTDEDHTIVRNINWLH
jgi:hypothetical protein